MEGERKVSSHLWEINLCLLMIWWLSSSPTTVQLGYGVGGMSWPWETPVYINCVNSPTEIWSEGISLYKKFLMSQSPAFLPPVTLLICKAVHLGKKEGSFLLPHFPQRAASLRKSNTVVSARIFFFFKSQRISLYSRIYWSVIPLLPPQIFITWCL